MRARARGLLASSAPAVRFYAVKSSSTDEALELFLDRGEAERVVEYWGVTSPRRGRTFAEA